MAGRVVELRAGAREPQVGDRLAWDGMGWAPEVNIARPHGVTHVHTDTIVRVVMGPWRSPDFVSGSAGWQIDADGSAEFNDVVVRGTIYADAGEIAGWTLAAGHLYAGTGAARVGLKPGTYPFYAGAEAEASAPFRVNTGGEMWATNAHISGEITATTGTIGGWTISATEIKSGTNIVLDSSVPSIVIGASGYIQSSSYVSGFDGFYIDNGFAEFGNVNVRGSLHCAVFVKDLISAHAGSLLVTKSAGKLTGDYTTAGTMEVETPPGGSWLFDNGDIIRIKEEYASGVHESWVTVTRAVLVNVYSTVLSNGDSTTYHEGATAVDYGASGDGGILQTADMTNAPWLSVFTHAGAPWTTLTHHLRLGNLKGTGDFSSDAYGVFIGDYSGNKWMSYDPTNSLRIRGDAIIEGTVAATMFTNDIGATLFSKADGLLLLGPNCEINDGEWWSLRRQKATITGAFHQEAGRWLGTRGLEIEEAGLNYALAPRMIDADSSGRADGWFYGDNFGSGGNATQTVVAHPVTERGWLQRLQYTGAVGDADDYCIVHDQTATGSFAQGDDVTISFDAKGSLVNCVVKIAVQELDASDVAGAIHNDANLTLTDYLQRFEYTFVTTDADCSKLRVRMTIYNVDSGDSFDVYFGAINIEKKAYATTFCCGALDWCSWSGTADDSTSTRTVTAVNLDAHTDLLSDNNTLSFRVVAQTPYDADAASPATQYIFDYRGADDSNRVLLRYDATADEFYVYINGNNRITNGSTQTFKAGDWLDLVLTLDFTNDQYYLYVNGVLDGSSTVGLTAPTGVVDWCLGSNYAGTGNQCNWVFTEYAVFDKVLSAAEVAALYALCRPLTDAGAMDRPGIYILDGRFKMASSLTGNRVQVDADGIRMVGTGLVDDVRRILFQDESSGLRTMGWVGAGWGGGGSDPCVTWLVATRDSGDPWPATAQVDVAAVDTVVGTDVRIVVNSNKTVEVYGEEIFKTEKLLRPGTGTSDPTAKLEDGCLFYRTDTDKLRLRANGAWVDLN